MHTPERRNPELTTLRDSITELESVGTDYADFMLMDTSVHVDLDKITGGFTLPPNAAEAFAEHGVPAPTSVESMNLDLSYDRGAGRFSILSGAAQFDNNFVVAFSRARAYKHHDEDLHRLDLFTNDARGRLMRKPIGLSPNRDLHTFISQCGVDIPLTSSGSSWDEIVPPLLSSAEHGMLTAQKVTVLSPIHEIVATEQIVESAVKLNDIHSAQRPTWLSKAVEYDFSGSGPDEESTAIPAWNRVISLQLVTYESTTVRAIEAIFRSDSFMQPPGFRGIYSRSGESSEVIAHKPAQSHILEPTKLLRVEGELIVPTAELTQYITFLAGAIRSAYPF